MAKNKTDNELLGDDGDDRVTVIRDTRGKIGHNSGDKDFPSKSGADARLLAFIQRVERVEAEKAELSEDIKEIYGEAKANGYDPKFMRKVVRARKMDVEKRREEEALTEVYFHACGLL